jgi:hypothetical protein
MRQKASLNLAKFAACLPSVGFYTQTAEHGTSHSFAAKSGSIRSTEDLERFCTHLWILRFARHCARHRRDGGRGTANFAAPFPKDRLGGGGFGEDSDGDHRVRQMPRLFPTTDAALATLGMSS